MKVGMSTLSTRLPMWAATAWAVMVLPVPGGPQNSIMVPRPYWMQSSKPHAARRRR